MGGSFCGSIAAICQPRSVLRTTTPPAEISRAMCSKLSETRGLVTCGCSAK